MKLTPGDRIPPFSCMTVEGTQLTQTSFPRRKLWLCLYRYAACPFCNLRVHQLCMRQRDVLDTGVAWVVVFPSSVERIKKFGMRYNPLFTLASDTSESVYDAFGADTSILGDLRTALDVPKVARALKSSARGSALAADGALTRMPSEFLVNEDGTIVRAFYGRVLDDGIDIDEVLGWARGS